MGGEICDPLRMPEQGWKLRAVVQAFVAGLVVSERGSLALATLRLIRHQQPEIAENCVQWCHKTEKLALMAPVHLRSTCLSHSLGIEKPGGFHREEGQQNPTETSFVTTSADGAQSLILFDLEKNKFL